ncbi:MAG: preprotein translocase subunit SecG [Ruminococcus sp.]|nr:preprotein translocase subunit SecG [Ruminococcus sp.]
MEIWEIIAGSLVLVSTIIIIILCLMQDKKISQNMDAISGGQNAESFYGQNAGRTKEAILKRVTGWAIFIMFVVTIVATIVAGHFSN